MKISIIITSVLLLLIDAKSRNRNLCIYNKEETRYFVYFNRKRKCRIRSPTVNCIF